MIVQLTEWLRVVPDWGSVPAWFAFVAACVAGGLTAFGVRTSNRQLRLAQEDKRRQLDRDRKEQAGKIAVWLSGNPQTGNVHIVGHNASDLPVYNARIWLVTDAETHLIHLPVMAPTSAPEDVYRATAALDKWSKSDQTILRVLREQGAIALALTFTDCEGAHWERDYRGSLLERATARESEVT